jgi:Phosphotransferase enzyme family
VSEGLIETYLSTLHGMWPESPAPALRRSRAASRGSASGEVGFYVLPDAHSPRMLVPADNSAAASRSLRRFSAALSVPDTVKRLGISATLRCGLAFPHRIEVSDNAASLRSWLSDVLGEPVEFSVALGTARANRKPVLQVFDSRGRSLAFAKVGATPLAEKHVAAEVEALTVLGAAGTPARIEVPKVIRAGRWHGILVLVMTSLDTSVWQRPSKQWELPTSVMDALHGHFAGHPQPLVQTPMWKSMHAARDQLAASQTRDRLDTALTRLERLAGDRDTVPGAWHGDWTPWNMARRRGRIQLWDWERFDTGVPRGLDRCHYGVNAVCRRDGASMPAVLEGLRLAGVDPTSGSDDDRLLAGTYLAAITCRYLIGADSELGSTVRDRSLLMLDTLLHVLRTAGR